jgi:serine/threonine-protein kinase
MSPEQARGKIIDKRVDIWAFGCVLFEMLTARRAFGGEDMTDTIVAVVTADPDWSALPAATPGRVRELVARCLAKDPKQRLHDIADARLELEQAMRAGGAQPSTAGVPAAHVAAHVAPQVQSRLWRIVPWALAATATLVAAVAIYDLRRQTDAPAGAAAHFSVELPDGLQLTPTPPALSPDGRRLAFSALGRGGIAIYTRDLDSFEVQEVAGSEDGLSPFFSPDGRWIGFHTGSLVKKVPVGGGEASTLARLPFWVGWATWVADSQIVVSGLNGGLWASPSEPGRAEELVELTRIDKAQGERVHQRPVALPDGRVLFTIVREGDTLIGVYDPASKRASPLGASGSPVAYLPTGDLVFQQAGRLMAAPFDLARTELSSSATSILQEATPDWVAFSSTGLVAYLHSPQGMKRRLVLVDRAGAHTPLLPDAGNYRWPRLSPDGRRLAVGTGRNIAVIDLQTGSRIQLQDEGINTEPVWTPDGRRLIYSSYRGSSADADLYWQPADGSGVSELLSSLPFDQWPTAVSPDGRVLAFWGQPKEKGYGIWTVTLDQAHTATQILSATGVVRGARFSPDGKWLAYSSDETGRSEVYVRPYPSLDAKWSVSREGGINPAWSPDGRELFYRSGSRMMVAEVTAAPAFSSRPPRVLSEGPFDVDIGGDIDYDVTPGGQHFVMMLVERTAQPRLRVLSGWTPAGSRK